MEYINSTKGKPKIFFEGFLYVRHKNLANGYEKYECEKRRHGYCQAAFKVKEDEVIVIAQEHTHAPDPGKAETLRVGRGIKRKAEDTLETPQQIITDSVTTISQGKTFTISHIWTCASN